MEFMHLLGAEQVQRAASQMSSAAQDMQRAADSIEASFFRHRQFMEQWIFDLQHTLEEHALRDFIVTITNGADGVVLTIRRDETGPSSNGKTPALQAGDEGSIPSGSTTST